MATHWREVGGVAECKWLLLGFHWTPTMLWVAVPWAGVITSHYKDAVAGGSQSGPSWHPE